MALPSNDDFANCELSTEQLDAIAAGGWFSNIVHGIEHDLKSFFTNKYVAGAAAIIIGVGAVLTGANYKQQ